MVIIEVDVGGGRRETQGHEVSCLNCQSLNQH